MKKEFKKFKYYWNGFTKKFYIYHTDNLIAELYWIPEKDQQLWIHTKNYDFNSSLLKGLTELVTKLEEEAGGIRSFSKAVNELGKNNDNS